MKKLFSILMFIICAFAAKAQDIIVKNDGESIKGYNVEIADNYVFYTLDKNSEIIKKIAKSELLVIKYENGERFYFDGTNTKNSQDSNQMPRSISTQYCDESLPDIKIEDFHGFLMEKGNVVYVDAPDTPWEIAGAETLRELLAKDGFWKVAARKEQAHFIIRYLVELKGRDHVLFKVYDTRYGLPEDLLKKQVNNLQILCNDNGTPKITTSENESSNINAAKNLYKKIIKHTQNQISKGMKKYTGIFAPFYVK